MDEPSQGDANAAEGRGAASASEAEVRRLQAELTALRELIGIAAHDLSNPLQSLTVLTELAAEEVPTSHEAHEKLTQSLEAAQRMRHMVRDLSEYARANSKRLGENTIVSTLQRCLSVFERRFERQCIALEVDVTKAFDEKLDASTARALRSAAMNTLLGVVGRATGSSYSEHLLTARVEGNTLRFDYWGTDGGGSQEPLALEAGHTERIRDAVAGTRLAFESAGGRVQLSLDA